MTQARMKFRKFDAGRDNGMVFNIQFHSTEDGPGIRTTIFMKGCVMRCPWCHNPEGLKRSPELVWYDIRCIGAQNCIDVCPNSALELTSEGMKIDRTRCDACGKCVDACPAAAFEVTGKLYTVDELIAKSVQDKVFFEKSGGGVTLSGGEVSLQADFIASYMQALKKEGIHVALDTCGGTRWEKLRRLVALSDLVLYDIKIMNSESHVTYTGVSLDLVLQNARNIAQEGKPMWVRTAIIPGFNDSEDNIRQTARFIRNNLVTTQRYDLLAFNNTCSTKYHRLDLAWDLEKQELLSEQRMECFARAAKDEGLDCVHWSGITKQT